MKRLGWLLGCALLVIGCAQPAPSATVAPTSAQEAGAESPTDLPATATPTALAATATAEPATATPQPPTALPATATPEPLPALAAEPQVVVFEAADGTALEGIYYPGGEDPSPVIVLMHWVRGNLHDWDAIAPWLQNRGVVIPEAAADAFPWLDASWFPPMPEGRSYAVFAFSFRGCEEQCTSFDREGWLQDAEAAMGAARQLEGVDPQRMVAVGASIGADGAADGCLLLNQAFPESCLGAFSLSPGGYLTLAYADVVAEHQATEPLPLVQCAYATEDVPSAQACQAAAGERYLAIEYPGGAHGMELVVPGGDPPPLAALLAFLEEAFE